MNKRILRQQVQDKYLAQDLRTFAGIILVGLIIGLMFG